MFSFSLLFLFFFFFFMFYFLFVQNLFRIPGYRSLCAAVPTVLPTLSPTAATQHHRTDSYILSPHIYIFIHTSRVISYIRCEYVWPWTGVYNGRYEKHRCRLSLSLSPLSGYRRRRAVLELNIDVSRLRVYYYYYTTERSFSFFLGRGRRAAISNYSVIVQNVLIIKGSLMHSDEKVSYNSSYAAKRKNEKPFNNNEKVESIIIFTAAVEERRDDE